jgi:hypothetical protein
VAMALVFVSIWLVLAAGGTAAGLTEGMRAFGFVMLPTTIVASLLVLYFNWRARLVRRSGLITPPITLDATRHKEANHA